jgi:C-terminal processing protease CtpA/Prc
MLPAESSATNSATNFGGVGIDGVPWADGRIVVKQLVLGGPAQQAGIRVGDIITHIDGKPTKGSDFREMVEYRLRGRAGTRVLLTIQRPGETKLRNYTLTRKQLVIGTSKKETPP